MSKPESTKASDRLDDTRRQLDELQEKMHGWNEYVREMRVLPDVGPALTTGRTELLALAKPRPLTEEECRVLFDMLGILIETNQALRMHSELVGQLADQQQDLLMGAISKVGSLTDYAQFRTPLKPGEDGD